MSKDSCEMRLAIGHYALGYGLLLLYGGQVCPFIDSLEVWEWARILAVVFVALFMLRCAAASPMVLSAPVALRGRRLFCLDLGLFALGGVVVGLINYFLLDFPLESGLKVLLGCATLGLFLGLDTALALERSSLKRGDFTNGPFEVTLPFTSVTRKIAVAGSAGAIMAALIIMLVVAKDILLLEMEVGMADIGGLIMAVGVEIGFVVLVLMGLAYRVIWSYSRNLKLLFAMQTDVLSAVGRGQLENLVPVVTDDEFGAVAEHTNGMIRGLREKQRIRSALGKVVDPAIADRLLMGDGELTLGGARRELVILFSDVRDFTVRTEGTSPEILVADLNAYFTRMVEIVRSHGGIVDKFIGDGLLAVFGLDLADGAAAHAVQAARDMLAALDEINPKMSEPMQIGVGVHQGSVISGLVGAPDRLEFTVVGDAVNVASRLESLTKDVGSALLISRELYDALPEAERHGLVDLGEHALKGKAERVRVFGFPVSLFSS